MLEVGVAGHDGVGVGPGLAEEHLLERVQVAQDPEEEVAEEEAVGGGVLVVPAAARLEPAGDVIADPLGQEVLDLDQIGAGVGIPGEAVGALVVDLQQGGQEGGPPGRRQDALLGQHHDVGQVDQAVGLEHPGQPGPPGHLVVLDQDTAPGAKPRFLQEEIVLLHAGTSHRPGRRWRRRVSRGSSPAAASGWPTSGRPASGHAPGRRAAAGQCLDGLRQPTVV